MNRRSIFMVAVNVGLGLSLASAAPAPTSAPTPQASVPVTVKTATTLTDAQQAIVRNFVESQVARLASAKTADQEDARDTLIKEADSSASAPYQDFYSLTLRDAAMKLADSADLHCRLNTAIAVGRIAERCQTLRLKPLAMKFTADKSSPVCLWGLKAVRAMLPLQLRSQIVKDDPFLTQVVPAISGNLVGSVTQQAYEAYRLNILVDRKDLKNDMLQAVIPPMQELVRKRVALYAKSTLDEPQSETLATSFLTDGSVWILQTESQKAQTLQSMADILSGASHRLATLDMKEAGSRIRREELMQTLEVIGGATKVVADTVKDDNLKNAAGYVANLDRVLDANGVVQLCDEVVRAIADTPQFKGKIKTPATAASK
jgi:hypothetical protein